MARSSLATTLSLSQMLQYQKKTEQKKLNTKEKNKKKQEKAAANPDTIMAVNGLQ